MLIIKTQKEFDARVVDGRFYYDGDVKFECDIDARNIDARNIYARNIYARNINARNIVTWNINAKNIDARNIDARNIYARNISAGNIVTMYDTIIMDTKCPQCDYENHEGQTKVLNGNRNNYTTRDYVGKMFRYIPCFHTCDGCGEDYTFNVKVNLKGILKYKLIK